MGRPPFTFTALDLADDVQFPPIVQRRHFVCTRCGVRTVNHRGAGR